jgi:hypothetical protein
MNIGGQPVDPASVPFEYELEGSHDWYIQRSLFGSRRRGHRRHAEMSAREGRIARGKRRTRGGWDGACSGKDVPVKGNVNRGGGAVVEGIRAGGR